MLFKASAPGSLMLLGEHAVLHGKPALVCAVDKRIEVRLNPRPDETVNIHSALGEYSTNLNELTVEKPFQFVLGVIKHFKGRIRRGCDIEITSNFSDKVGLGSSAAVTVATLAAIVTWQDIRMTPIDMIRQGRNIIRAVQGLGSGADIAASVYGGIVAYQTQPLSAEKLSVTHPLTALYAGYKTPTVDVVKHVQAAFARQPELLRHLLNGIGQCTIDGLQMLRKKNWKGFGSIMNIQQGLMEALGVNTPQLSAMINWLRDQQTTEGSKISGSGLGDCVIAWGECEGVPAIEGTELIPVQMTLEGVRCEKS